MKIEWDLFLSGLVLEAILIGEQKNSAFDEGWTQTLVFPGKCINDHATCSSSGHQIIFLGIIWEEMEPVKLSHAMD